MIKTIKNFIKNSVALLAPYTVIGKSGKLHHCWTYEEALVWVRACNTRVIGGVVSIHNWNGEVIAQQYMTPRAAA